MPPYMYPDKPLIDNTTNGIRDNMSTTPKESPVINKKHGNGHVFGNFASCICITKYSQPLIWSFHVALSNGDAGDTDSSQETFEIFGSGRKRMSGMLSY